MKVTAMDVYKLLPQTNCEECGEASCMAFATKLSDKEIALEKCSELDEKQFAKLEKLIAPAVREIAIGTGNKVKTIGGDEVLYRYEESYYNQTLFAIDVPDTLSDEDFDNKVNIIENTEFERTGEILTLDGIALRNKSGNATKFAKAAKKLKNAKYPVILCSFDPIAMDAALKEIGDERPLIYAANENNLNEMADLAIKYDCPITAFAPGDLEKLKELVFNLRSLGIKDIVLDPGTFTGNGIGDTIDNFVMCKRLAIEENDEDFRFPIIGIPALSKLDNTDEDISKDIMEATYASILINKYADALIIEGSEIWEMIPILTLRQGIYTDPRKPQAVDPGYYPIGDVDENSPVILTTNFALTFYTVEGDLKSAKSSCYILVLDTVGKAVDVAIAGGQFDGKAVADLLKDHKIEDTIKTRKMVIPGLAASVSGEIEDETGWDVLVGPRDSSAAADFIIEKF
ncbi:acetyl-CoA decarbonylase/synthase complex subunit gamma [Methanobrevibacter filiformis]|uniref:Acetyl-CoA decarbonylase/synthase complex subunit gamma n=1 Tax=Methanobrevibacter filiformis TaxID=55758 RepID=A0A166C0P9_9EURY|nr:acetyl-CoA decarbonylase/synthase complex subunit gamma [Methanobrevibacter filiformis]KZX10397.1 corrinoid/iron-sulfur protein large subunit [Methanobrevibacter filiformis]